MRTIGILGGMSAESTAVYYRLFNEGVRARRGGLHSADLVVRSLDFAPVAAMQARGAWDEAASLLSREAGRLAAAGAELLVLASNTMHKVAGDVVLPAGLALVHIADATGAAVARAGFLRPGLMATRFTMEDGFYTDRLRDGFGLEPVLPDDVARLDIHDVIYRELCCGVISEASRIRFEAVAAQLAQNGADCLILGCTEVGLLLNAGNVAVPVFDTVACHVEAALALAISG